MPTFEITSPDGRVLEIEGEKAPSAAELDQIFSSIPKASANQSALNNVKTSDDLPDEGTTLLDRFNQARESAAQIRSKYKQDFNRYYDNMPEKEKGMSWIEYAKLCKKYNYDFAMNQGKNEFMPMSANIELNPLKFAWKNSILGGIGGDLYRNQKDKRAAKYTNNTEVLTEIPQAAKEDWDKKGQIKAGEAFMRSDWSRTIPFVGSGNTLDEITDIQKIVNKRNNGEQLSKKEITELNSYIMDVAEMQYRGVSFGGKLIQGAMELPSFAGEFMATGGLAAIGKEAVQKTLTKGLQDATKKEIGKRLTKGLVEGAAGASVRTIGMPQRVAENYGMRKLNDSLGLTDKGEVVLETAQESPAKTFLKAYGDTVIENWSEEMGAGIAEGVGIFGKGTTKYASELAEKLFGRNAKAAFLKAVRKFRPNATVKDFATRAGFNGILGEMSEERAGDVLRAVFGIDDREDLSTFEKICEAINPGAEELLLELGLFSIPGSMSFAASRVANHLRRRNLDENDINDYMRLTSELEKENLLHDIADNNDLSQTVDFQQKVSELKNRYYTQNLNAGLEKDEALATADIQAGAISSLAKNIGMDIQELNDKFAINLQSMSDEQAQEQYDEDTQMVLQGRVEKHNQDFVGYAGATESEVEDAQKEWQEKGTDSKYFKKWFGDSKVINDNGKPRKVFHGSLWNFDTFEKGGEFDFSFSPNFAYDYAAQKSFEQGLDESPVLYSVYLKVENPFDFRDEKSVDELLEKIGDKEIDFWGNKYTHEQFKDHIMGFAYENTVSQADFEKAQIGMAYSRWNDNVEEKMSSVATDRIVYKNDKYFIALSEIDEPRRSPFSSEPQGRVDRDDVYKQVEEMAKDVDFGDEQSKKFTIHTNLVRTTYELGKGYVDEKTPYELEVKLKKIDNPKYAKKGTGYDNWSFMESTTIDGTNFVDFLKENGYDGYYKQEKEQLNISVFSPEQIKSDDNIGTFDANNPNIHYQAMQNIVDWTDKFDKVPTFEEIEKHIRDIIASGEVFDTLSPEWKIDIKGGNRVVDKITNQGNFQKLNNPQKKRHNKYVSGIKELINNSIYSHSDTNDKPKEKPDVINYHYFDVNVKIGEKSYWVRLECEENKKSSSGIYAKRSKTPFEDNSNVNQTEDNVKTVHLYNIKEMKANKNQVHYEGGNNINNARGFTYQRYNFDGTTKDNLIVLLKNKADKSTLLHEFAHVYLTTLNNIAHDNARAKDLLLTVNKWLRYNGQEYTTAQHEKFANGFVAYVRSGKAPTYSLKRAFENFRRWLNDFYNDLQFNDKVELDDDTKKVFDELIGDISVDAKEERMQQILDDAKQNALLKLSYEFADKHRVQPLMLTDRQRRYRDTAFDIIFYALRNTKDENGEPLVKDRRELYMLFNDSKDYNKRNKGVKHRREQLEQYLLEVDDVFSGNDGFLPEWGEFFGDPGVSYDNAVTRADADLARQALEVINEKRYLYETDNNNNLFSDEDIQKTEYELDYILEVFANNKDERDIVCGAFYTWIDNVHEYMQDDMLNRWENRTNEIERYESLSKFQQAKEDLKLYAATLKGQGDYAQQFAQYARAIIKRLDFMTESDKGKIFDKLKEFNSFREVEENLDDVMDYAETLNEVTERKLIADQIVREVKQTIHTWQNGIRKTKYTYPANKLFTRLREIEKMKVEEVRDLYDEVVNEEFTPDYNSDAVNEEDYYATIEKLYIKFRANDRYYLPTDFLKDLRDRIQSAKFTAKVARDEMDFERKMQQISLIDECAEALNARKKEIDKNDKIKDVGQLNVMGANFNGMLKMIFNDTIKNKFSLDYLYAKKDGQVGKDRREFLDKAKKIWGYREGRIGDVELFNRFINMTQKEDDLSIYERYSPSIEDGSYRVTSEDKESGKQITERTVNIRENADNALLWKSELKTLSRMEVLYFYIQSKNEESYKILTDEEKGQFDKNEFDNLINKLTDQEKMLGDVMQLAAEKYWDALNAYHIKKYHTELGKVKGYFPRRSATTEVKVLDMFNDFTQPTTTGKFQKQRTAGPGTRVNESNALAVLFDHMEKANTIIIMGEQLDLMNHVFNNSDLAHKIENVWGEKVKKEFYHQITSNLFTGQSVMSSLSETFLARLVGNAVKAAIFFKPQIGIKQVISFMNYGKGDDYVTAKEWASEFAKQTITPQRWKKNIEYMMNIPYLKDRFSRGGSTDALKRELESRIFSKTSLLDEFFGMPVSVGDISAIILGGKPYIDALRKKGYSEDQAIKIFIETTVNDQQSSIPSTLSNMQRNSTKNALSKMFFAFQNTPWQYFRQCTTTVMQAVQTGNKKDMLKAGKMLFLYGWVFPAIFGMASSLSPLIFAGTGDDDKLLNDLNPVVTFSSLFTQHPIFGELIKSVLDGYDGKVYNSQDLMTRYIRSVNKLVRDIRKDKVTVQDVWDAVVAFGEPATGIPINSISNFAAGIFDAVTGNFAEGAIKMMGYSDYKAKQVTGKK